VSIECSTKVVLDMSIWVQLKGFVFYSDQEVSVAGETFSNRVLSKRVSIDQHQHMKDTQTSKR
jgi:hypothetical protein